MGRASTKQNKTQYQILREELGLTRERASETLGWISQERIEKIESEKSLPHPDEVLAMSVAYKSPGLCNYYYLREFCQRRKSSSIWSTSSAFTEDKIECVWQWQSGKRIWIL